MPPAPAGIGPAVRIVVPAQVGDHSLYHYRQVLLRLAPRCGERLASELCWLDRLMRSYPGALATIPQHAARTCVRHCIARPHSLRQTVRADRLNACALYRWCASHAPRSWLTGSPRLVSVMVLAPQLSRSAAPPLLVHPMLHAGCMLWPATAHEAMWSHRRFIVFESLRASTHASAAVLLEEVTPPAPRGARLAVSRWRKQA